MRNETTIPLLVDDVKNLENFEMTRLVYFNIGTVEYLANLTIEYGQQEFPITVMDLHGIITQTSDRTEFTKAMSIDTLFDEIEKFEELFVDTNDIWLPNRLFNKICQRGDLFRITTKLFKIALAYRFDKISYPHFLEQTSNLGSEIFESPIEDQAFKEWSINQIEFAKNAYHKRGSKRNLKYEKS